MLDHLAILSNKPDAHVKEIKRLFSIDLLIVDEWLFKDANASDTDELFSVVDGRTMRHKSTVFCSQYMIGDWPERMGG